MIRLAARNGSPRDLAAAFTLTEIALALAIIAVAMVGIIGVLPAGLNASRQAVDHTVVSTILDDIHHRLQNETLKEGPLSFSPAYFDERGVFIPADDTSSDSTSVAERQRSRLYRADVKISHWRDRPANTSSLLPVVVEISWPLDGKGKAIGPDNPKTIITSSVTTLTGPDWEKIDQQFVPKVEF